MDISCDGSLKDILDSDELPQLWLPVRKDFSSRLLGCGRIPATTVDMKGL
jgi:hypothetical protein